MFKIRANSCTLLLLLDRKFGEEEWNAMSHKEQQEHLSRLRAEEAQLMAGIEVKDRWVLIACWFACSLERVKVFLINL